MSLSLTRGNGIRKTRAMAVDRVHSAQLRTLDNDDFLYIEVCKMETHSNDSNLIRRAKPVI